MNKTINKKPELSRQPVYIDTMQMLDKLIKTVSEEQIVAVDTESDSLYSYFEKVCLVQFSTPKADYLVDTLRVDLSGLGAFFASPKIQKVFHAAEYDIITLTRDYGFNFANLFDTMLSARILGWPRYGLGSILEEHFGVKVDKRFQRYDWSKRPLAQKALNYARLDTYYLLDIRKIQLEELIKHNRLNEATEAFERQLHIKSNIRDFSPDDFWRIKGCKGLEAQEQAILRELNIMRDKIAREIDHPAFKIIPGYTLIELAKQQPTHSKFLSHIRGLSGRILRYNSYDIINAIKKGQKAPRPNQPNQPKSDNIIMARYQAMRNWRNNRAEKRGVEPDVIISNQVLMNIANHNPKTLNALAQSKILGEWQQQNYGQDLLNLLKNIK